MILKKRIDSGCDVRFWNCTYESVFHLAVLEEKECRNASDSELDCNLLTIIDIALRHDGFAFIFGSDFLNSRSKSTARAAPCCPKIHNYRNRTGNDI